MLAKFKTWLILAGGGVLAILAALAYGFLRGRSAGKAKATETIAKAKTRAARVIIHAQETRHDVEIETSKLPDASPLRVDQADPDTAAGHLADRWMRDRDAKG